MLFPQSGSGRGRIPLSSRESTPPFRGRRRFVWSIWFVSLFAPETPQPDKPNKPDQPDRPDRLFGLQVVELVDEPLELGDGVAALGDGDLLIDGKGHRFDSIAHLSDDVLIGLRGCRVRIED
jgi:hypothetical protein